MLALSQIYDDYDQRLEKLTDGMHHTGRWFYAGFITIRVRGVMFPGRLSVRQLTRISRDMISLHKEIEIHKLIYSSCELELMKRFSRSEVKGQGHMCRNV